MVLGCFACPATASADPKADGEAFFEKRVRPLLQASCFECHNNGPDSEGGLELDSREHALAGGEHGPALVPGSPDESLLLKAVRHEGDLKMPPERRLTSSQVDDLREWIAVGAPWPVASASIKRVTVNELWSLKPIQDPPPPTVGNEAWRKSPIDRFILQRLESEGLDPAAPADRATLLRRLCFDLTGLPPTKAELEAFLSDESPDAVDRLIDRLLASPHYGERWARHWLDLVRFAETNGFEKNRDKPNAYRYRDYCIEAFNSDVPYDRFVREHVAGDLLPPRESADGQQTMSTVASGFWWFNEMIDFVVDWPMARAEEVENQLDVAGKAFLGLSVGCARCHDHKFDPIDTADYYSLAGILRSSTDVQGCVDSPRRAAELATRAQELEQNQTQIDALLAKAFLSAGFAARRQDEARRIAEYLAASRELLACDNCSDEELAKVAARRGLDPQRLRRWIGELSTSISRGNGLFDPWLRLSRCPDELFSYRKQALSRQLARSTPHGRLPQRTLFDFEQGNYDGWTVAGAAFAGGPSSNAESTAVGYAGGRFASSFAGSDRFTGKLLSPRFLVDKPNLALAFLIAGGNHPERACVNLIVHSQTMHQYEGCTATGNNSDRFTLAVLPLRPFWGREVSIEIVDDEQGEWGHIMADHFSLIELPDEQANPGQAAPLANSALQELLAGPTNSNAELDAAYQSLVLATLAGWQQEVERYLDQPQSADAIPAALHFAREGLDFDARGEILGWALSDDSPLGERAEAEEFLSPVDRARLQQLREERSTLENGAGPSALAIVAQEAAAQDVAIEERGNAHRLGKVVPRGRFSPITGRDGPRVERGSGRLEVAEWLASKDNPLTARVIVNRVWSHHFGRGLVATVDDFGSRGEAPSHPELLDYLASQFIESGWSIKALHRLLLTTATYQQSSVAGQRAQAIDPDNRWLSHMPVRRLEAECVRDSILAASGRLIDAVGGPSVSMKPPSLERQEYIPGANRLAGCPPRRTIYLEVRRAHIPELLTLFDFPAPENCVGRRNVSIVPLQSLNLMDDEFIVTEARRWGAQLAKRSPDRESLISAVYTQAFGRAPTAAERQAALAFLDRQRARYEQLGSGDVNEQVWTDFCHLAFNLSEFIFVR